MLQFDARESAHLAIKTKPKFEIYVLRTYSLTVPEHRNRPTLLCNTMSSTMLEQSGG